MIQTISVENRKENNLFHRRAEKLTASPTHRWAEQRGALVLCRGTGNNACKKVLGQYANLLVFFQRREDCGQGHSQIQSCSHRGWQQPNFSLVACHRLLGMAFWLHFKYKESLTQSRAIMADTVCHQKKSRMKAACPSVFSSSSLYCCKTQKWELHDRAHLSQFTPPHWWASLRVCDCNKSWILGFKSRTIDSFPQWI